MLVGGVVGYVFRRDVDDSVYRAMWTSIPSYNNDTTVTRAWDEIQRNVSLSCASLVDITTTLLSPLWAFLQTAKENPLMFASDLVVVVVVVSRSVFLLLLPYTSIRLCQFQCCGMRNRNNTRDLPRLAWRNNRNFNNHNIQVPDSCCSKLEWISACRKNPTARDTHMAVSIYLYIRTYV